MKYLIIKGNHLKAIASLDTIEKKYGLTESEVKEALENGTEIKGCCVDEAFDYLDYSFDFIANKEKIFKDVRDGLKYTEIARKYGCVYKSLTDFLRRYNYGIQ